MDVLDEEQWFDSGIEIDGLDFEFEVIVAAIIPRPLFDMREDFRAWLNLEIQLQKHFCTSKIMFPGPICCRSDSSAVKLFENSIIPNYAHLTSSENDSSEMVWLISFSVKHLILSQLLSFFGLLRSALK